MCLLAEYYCPDAPQSMVWYFLPALLLYAVDGVYRLTQGTVDGGCARLLRAFAVADEQVWSSCRVVVGGCKGGQVRATGPGGWCLCLLSCFAGWLRG